MSGLKQLAQEFVTTQQYPLQSRTRVLGFIENNKRQFQFLQNIKKFREANPNLNFFELGKAIEDNFPPKGSPNRFRDRFEGLVEFMNNPQDPKGLEMMTKGFQNIPKDYLDTFDKEVFEEFSKDPPVIFEEIEMSEGTEEAAGVSVEDVTEVVSPKIRGGSVAKEMKEAEEAKARDPERLEDVTQRVSVAQKKDQIEREKIEREDKLAKTKVDSMGNTFDTEDDPRVIDPPIMSPDERDKILDEAMDEFEAEELDIEELDISTNPEANRPRQQPPPSTAVPATAIPTTQAQAQTQSTQTQSTQTEPQTSESPTGKVEVKEINDIPQDVLAIPKERASAKGKSEEQLIDDIEFFFKTYPEMLDKEKVQFNKIQRGKSPALRKKQLMELHRRIVAKIGNIEDDKENKRIGIILNANKYLDDKINAILLQKLTEGLTPASLVVDVSGKTDEDKSKRVGSYQITKGRSGLLNAQKAPIYRSIPSSNDSQMRKSKGPIKLKTLPTQRWDEVNTAKKQVKTDPFIDTNKRPNRFNIYL